MLESFIFIAVALIGGSFCTSRSMKQLDEIRKPENVSDYNHEWKTGLYSHYERIAMLELDDYNATFSHL